MANSSRNFPPGCFDFFITARCDNKDWFRIPLPQVWDLFGNYLNFLNGEYVFTVRAFVLMANHFHMLVTVDTAHLPLVMNYLMRESAKEINRMTNRINHVWGRPYHPSLVRGFIHYQNAYKYLYRNPIEAGVCNRVEEYQFSTLRGLLGFEQMMIPVEDGILFADVESQLRWLNTKPINKDYRKEIRQMLRRKHFACGSSGDRAKRPNDQIQI